MSIMDFVWRNQDTLILVWALSLPGAAIISGYLWGRAYGPDTSGGRDTLAAGLLGAAWPLTLAVACIFIFVGHLADLGIKASQRKKGGG